ncbi:hypothetical protein DFJ73DRAFT_822797 [Zopfochytrium polystomum]|nr:hypothetical protein DFJ73DRAFT_822797 [Zopfochytrium polystomum]
MGSQDRLASPRSVIDISGSTATAEVLDSSDTPTSIAARIHARDPATIEGMESVRSSRTGSIAGTGGTDLGGAKLAAMRTAGSLKHLNLSSQSIAAPFDHQPPPIPRTVPPPSSDWRRNASGDTPLNMATTTVPTKEKWTTSMATINNTSLLAVGCASSSNNLFIFENTADPVRWNPDSHTPSGAQVDFLKVRSAFTAPDPIYSLSVADDLLITAGPSSAVQLFRIDLTEIGKKGKGLEHLGACRVSDLSLESVKVAPPGTRSSSVRVHKVAFAPSSQPTDQGKSSRRFLSLHNRQLHVCDSATMSVVLSETVSFDQLTAAAWSPHHPSNALIAVGGVDHHLSVVDTRLMGLNGSEKAAVWKAERAHGGQNHPAITSVQFSPFVPYWLASAAEDAVIKIWDLRYLKFPAGRIEGHYQGVRAMAFSNCHAEILASGSTDCSFRAWNMDASILTPRNPSRDIFVGCPGTEWGDPSKQYGAFETGTPIASADPDAPVCVGARLIGESPEKFDGSIISVLASTSHLNTFYSLSSTGELASFTLRRETLESLAPHRYGPSSSSTTLSASTRPSKVSPTGPSIPQTLPVAPAAVGVTDDDDEDAKAERAIETCVHTRDLEAAFKAVTELSRRSLATRRGVAKHERALIELCTARPPVDEKRWKIASVGGAKGSGAAKGGGLVGAAGVAGSLPRGKKAGAAATTDAALEGGIDMVEKFRSDLEIFSYYLPPGFGTFKKWYEMIPSKTRLEFEMIVLRYNILVDAAKGSWENIVKAEKMILKGMEVDPTFMEPDTLKLLVEAVLPHDYTQGLGMGIKFVEIVDATCSATTTNSMTTNTSKNRFQQLGSLISLLLYPTVFDGADGLVDPSNLEAYWGDGRGSGVRQVWVRQYLEEQKTATSVQSPVGAAEKNDEELAGIDRRRRGIPRIAVGDERDLKRTIGMDAVMNSSKEVLRMLRTEWRIIKILAKSSSNEAIADTIIKIVTEEEEDDATANETNGGSATKPTTGTPTAGQSYRVTLSATTNRLFLDALVFTGRFEEYFQVCCEFVTSYSGNAFSRVVQRHMEVTSANPLKTHTERTFSSASTHLTDAMQVAQLATAASGQSVSMLGQTVTGATRALREGIATLAKIGATLAMTMEAKAVLDREGIASMARCVWMVQAMLGQLSGSLLKTLETLERTLGKTGTAGAYARDAASLTQEDIRQACRGYPKPSEAKTRATAAAVMAATGCMDPKEAGAGAALMEEVFAIVERLGKIARPAGAVPVGQAAVRIAGGTSLVSLQPGTGSGTG